VSNKRRTTVSIQNTLTVLVPANKGLGNRKYIHSKQLKEVQHDQ